MSSTTKCFICLKDKEPLDVRRDLVSGCFICSECSEEINEEFNSFVDEVRVSNWFRVMANVMDRKGEHRVVPGEIEKLSRKERDSFQSRIETILSTTTCGHCDYDEASGDLFAHCNKCCHKIVKKVWGLCFMEKKVSSYGSKGEKDNGRY